jgi:hypothetical protein
MSEVTVNELMVIMKNAKTRVWDLKTLRQSSSKTEKYYLSDDKEREVKPEYDAKAVDRKIIEIEKFLMKADSAIKQSNAITKVNVDIDVDSLFAPIE